MHYGADAANVGGTTLWALTQPTCLCIAGALMANGWGMVGYYYTPRVRVTQQS